jgi:ATP sulfurylase
MAKIGLIAMSAKPYHAGHDGLVRLAASENDEVHLYVSTTDRDNVSGAAMARVWAEIIEPTLPPNVKVTYGGSPVGNIWKELGEANESKSDDVFQIYSDPDDIVANFPNVRIAKYAGDLLNRGKVIQRPVQRTETVDVSGTELRGYLAANDKRSFLKKLPKGVDGEAYWAAMKAGSEALAEAAAKKRSRRART